MFCKSNPLYHINKDTEHLQRQCCHGRPPPQIQARPHPTHELNDENPTLVQKTIQNRGRKCLWEVHITAIGDAPLVKELQMGTSSKVALDYSSQVHKISY
jgi:hypothetical protein